MPDFVHLHAHSEYSLRESTLRLASSIQMTRAFGMTSLAITDTNALYGAIPFYNQATAAGIKPIIGVQLAVCTDDLADALASGVGLAGRAAVDTAVFLAQDFAGYQDLVRLVTLAQRRVRRPVVTFSEVAAHTGHVLALIGGGESLVLRRYADGSVDEAERWLKLWLNHWPVSDLYADIQDHSLVWERQGLPAIVRFARFNQIPLVATNDVHYATPDDADLQRILAQMDNHPEERVLEGDRYHLASAEEMWHRFSRLPEAAANTVAVAERCNFELPPARSLLPRYPTQDGESAAIVLRKAALAGAKQRYGEIREDVANRLEYELSIIERLGFADYFLVVADFIRFAHRSGISTGPGRGSAASSLVAYALRITAVDPLHHKLLFERFLNPERVSWPDIDTDFEYERRAEVIAYVVERYGVEHVAQIGTFGTFAAKAAIRDAGRALQTDAKVVDQLARQIPSGPGMTLERALKEAHGLAAWLESTPAAKALWDIAARLEGLPRHTSTHAAGVLISPIPISDLVPTRPGGDGTPVTQYPMEVVEQLGLMKMDFLGLTTLTLIDRCLASIEAHTGRRIDWQKVATDDKPTYEMLSRGEVDGCFQLESGGMRRVLRDLRPSGFDDLVAVISLYRPGPMENIPAFIAAKHGRVPIHYPHPDLEPILKDTYGVVVYQEQIMQIAARMAGFSMGQSDLLRRAVGKKKRDVLTAERERFVSGCIAKDYSPEVAHHVYDLIVRFADYGFPLSHASAYSVLTFRTAYLRANWFAHFAAAILSMHMGDENKVKTYVKDAQQRGIEVRPASVCLSSTEYTVEQDGQIRMGLLAVKNVGKGAVDAILEARQDRPFESLADFLARVNSRTCNRRAVESLLLAGAFSDFVPQQATPAVMLQILEEAYQTSEAGKQSQGLGLVFSNPQASTSTRTEQHTSAENVLFIRYDARTAGKQVLRQIQQVLKVYPGDVRVALYNQANQSTRMLEPSWSVSLRPELISLLEETVGIGNAKLGHHPSSSKSRSNRL